MNSQNKIKTLYNDGLVKFENFFEPELLEKIVKEKNNLFREYPYGQDDNLQKKSEADFVRPGSYMIWDIIEKNSIFYQILENKFIKDVALRVLGSNYTVSTFYIRKTPKINEILNPHIDYQGGLSFSILLDEINLNQGETFFYKKSHKLPPPNFVNKEKLNLSADSITGKIGDTFFWFPDCWHGRNANTSQNETSILMCHLGNSNHPSKDATGRTVNYSKQVFKTENNKKIENKILGKIFKICGRSSNNFFTHFLYCLLYFKFNRIAQLAIEQKAIFTRKKYGDINIDNFSIFNYLKSASFMKVIIISTKQFIKKIIGKK